ncbi:FacC-like extracellular signaling protein, partial [Metarhizium majus ARSEF 297]
MAAEGVGADAHLWTEAGVNPDSGYGLKLARGVKHTAAFPLSSAAKGDFSKLLVNLHQPVINGLSDVFQGYATYGQYLYVFKGTSYEKSGGKVNSEVTSVDMKTGTIQQGPLLTKAGESLSSREPEGVAVYVTASGEPRLFLGFAAGTKAGQRRSHLYYKNEPVRK